MIATPKEVEDMLIYTDYASLPILKSGATDKQKIVYANYIVERLNEGKADTPFFNNKW